MAVTQAVRSGPVGFTTWLAALTGVTSEFSPENAGDISRGCTACLPCTGTAVGSRSCLDRVCASAGVVRLQGTNPVSADLHGARYAVVVIDGGQAGLSMSYLLTRHRIDHIVLERHRIGHEWREPRWDSFCLVTPNWQCQLPGFPYSGDDPDGFMSREEVVAHLEAYAASFDPPLVDGVAATELRRSGRGGFTVDTSAGTLTAPQVVLATGPYQVPLIPRMADRLPDELVQLHSSDDRSPEALPPGRCSWSAPGSPAARSPRICT
jgi:hypothetical protein